eukprot:350891-Chlamydomonas_euryale.AAC.3
MVALAEQAVNGSPADATPGIQLAGVSFSYPGCPPTLKDLRLEIPRGSRCLLIGANGTGKTTMLQLVAGKYMVGKVRGHTWVPVVHTSVAACTATQWQATYLGHPCPAGPAGCSRVGSTGLRKKRRLHGSDCPVGRRLRSCARQNELVGCE